MKHTILGGAAALAALGGAAAQTVDRDPATAPSGVYLADESHAHLYFRINHQGLSMTMGRFEDFDARLDYDAANPMASKIGASIRTASASTNIPRLDGYLSSANFFNAAKFPEARFAASKIERTTPGAGIVHGDLTIAGVTKPVTLEVTFNGHGLNRYEGAYFMGFSAKATIMRAEWGLKQFLPGVGNDVDLIIEAEFMRQD